MAYQADTTAQRRLQALGIDARLFLVRRRIPGSRVRPAADVLEPAFPGYLIARAEPHDVDALRFDYKHGINGALTAIGQPHEPAILSDHAMLALLAMAARNRHVGSDSVLGEVGADGVLRPIPTEPDAVRDLTGQTLLVVDDDSPLAGLRGECLHSGADRVVLLLRLLGAERRVTVRRGSVRVV